MKVDMVRTVLPIIALFWIMPGDSSAVELHEEFPSEIHAQERYVFYEHGLIVEGDDPQPVHGTHGIYDFPAITEKLFEGGNFNLIAQHRPKDTDIEGYVEVLVGRVKRLVTAGVPASRISLVGFSRGSHLVAFASSRLSNHGINTGLLASCFDGDIVADPPIELTGHLLSIYEVSDVPGSCSALAERGELLSFEELAIDTGQGHGAFYSPLEDWLLPLKGWVQKTNR